MDMTSKEKARLAYIRIYQAFEKGKQDLIDIIKENGGIIRTPASSDKSPLWCICDHGSDDRYETIQALAYDEGEGLMILTNNELHNYEYDEGCEFEYLYDFKGEDLERYLDATKDITYFRELDDYQTDAQMTLFSILMGIDEYLA